MSHLNVTIDEETFVKDTYLDHEQMSMLISTYSKPDRMRAFISACAENGDKIGPQLIFFSKAASGEADPVCLKNFLGLLRARKFNVALVLALQDTPATVVRPVFYGNSVPVHRKMFGEIFFDKAPEIEVKEEKVEEIVIDDVKKVEIVKEDWIVKVEEISVKHEDAILSGSVQQNRICFGPTELTSATDLRVSAAVATDIVTSLFKYDGKKLQRVEADKSVRPKLDDYHLAQLHVKASYVWSKIWSKKKKILPPRGGGVAMASLFYDVMSLDENDYLPWAFLEGYACAIGASRRKYLISNAPMRSMDLDGGRIFKMKKKKLVLSPSLTFAELAMFNFWCRSATKREGRVLLPMLASYFYGLYWVDLQSLACLNWYNVVCTIELDRYKNVIVHPKNFESLQGVCAALKDRDYKGTLLVVGTGALPKDFCFNFVNLNCLSIAEAFDLYNEDQSLLVQRDNLLEIYMVQEKACGSSRRVVGRSFIKLWMLTRELISFAEEFGWGFMKHCEPHNLTILVTSGIVQFPDTPRYFLQFYPREYLSKHVKYFVLANLVRTRAIIRMNFSASCEVNELPPPYFRRKIPIRYGIKKVLKNKWIFDEF